MFTWQVTKIGGPIFHVIEPYRISSFQSGRKHLSKRFFCLIGVLPLLAATAARGCPFCDTYTGQRVHQGIWDAYFWHNVLLTALPFAVFTVIIALLYFGVPFTRRNHAD